eukprot:TCONS_00058393-protein
MASRKRDPPSPLEDISKNIGKLKDDFTRRKKMKVHFLEQMSTSSPKNSVVQPESDPVFNEDVIELVSGFDSSSSSSRPWSNSVAGGATTFDSSNKIKKHEHSFEKPYNLETMNSYINNFKLLSAKKAHTKSSVLSCEIDITDIEKLSDKDNWSDKITKLQIDKRSRLLDSYCEIKLLKTPISHLFLWKKYMKISITMV